jgi:5-hydroxyisourate hydrolase
VSISISTHVLDTAAGGPAAGVRVELVRERQVIGGGETDGDGRIPELAANLEPGRYALVFWPPSPFFTRVELEVEVVEGHYHVPLLVSPYGCASYRGS